MLTGSIAASLPPEKTKPASVSRRRVSMPGGMRGGSRQAAFSPPAGPCPPPEGAFVAGIALGEVERRGRDLNPRRTFQHVRDFQSRSLGHSDTSPCCEAEKEGFEPSMEAFTPITP